MSEITSGNDRDPFYREIHEAALNIPVPHMSDLRTKKLEYGYDGIPIDLQDPRSSDPTVWIAELGLAGQAYYSRPNVATGNPLPDVPPELRLRASMAEKLRRINASLGHPAITEFFGGAVELYVEDALRPVWLQHKLHDQVFPDLLRRNSLGITDQEVARRLPEIIARGSDDPSKPSPHFTGGACDVMLRYRRQHKGYVRGAYVPMGREDGDMSERMYSDYFEYTDPQSADEERAQRLRRGYFAILSGTAFGVDTELAVNPTEFWHWSYGDQLWAMVRDESSAFYTIPE